MMRFNIIKPQLQYKTIVQYPGSKFPTALRSEDKPPSPYRSQQRCFHALNFEFLPQNLGNILKPDTYCSAENGKGVQNY